MNQNLLHPAPVLRVFSQFGVGLEGRSWSAGSGYRYGFSGKEKDDECMGGGGQTYDYGFRIYNPGLAKFLSVDPLSASYPWYTPYQFAGNKPIWAIDLDGLEEYWYVLEIHDGKPKILNWRREESRWLMDIFGEQYVSYTAHISYNGEWYTFTEKWGTTHITDEFHNDPNNPKWLIYKDKARDQAKTEIETIAECYTAVGAIKALFRACKSASETSNTKNEPSDPEQVEQEDKSKWGTYAPDRQKPRNSDGTPCVDKDPDEKINGPHTQLGKNRDGSYNQAREFDANGKPVKDVDFTDHGYPDTHPNPHQHNYIPNKTGGTSSRDKVAKPLTVGK